MASRKWGLLSLLLLPLVGCPQRCNPEPVYPDPPPYACPNRVPDAGAVAPPDGGRGLVPALRPCNGPADCLDSPPGCSGTDPQCVFNSASGQKECVFSPAPSSPCYEGELSVVPSTGHYSKCLRSGSTCAWQAYDTCPVGTLAPCTDGGSYGYARCEAVTGSTPRWAACEIPPPPVPRVRYCWDADNDSACKQACDVCPARGYPDAPLDSHWRVAQTETDCPTDCDDKNPAAQRQDKAEICDGYDNNCNGQKDEGLKSCGPWMASGTQCTFTEEPRSLVFKESSAGVNDLLGGADWRPPQGPAKGWALVQLVLDFSNGGSGCQSSVPMQVECEPAEYCYWRLADGEEGSPPESMAITASDFANNKRRLLGVLPSAVVRLRKKSTFGDKCERNVSGHFESIKPIEPYCVP